MTIPPPPTPPTASPLTATLPTATPLAVGPPTTSPPTTSPPTTSPLAVALPPWTVLVEQVAALPADAPLGQRLAPLLRNLSRASGTGQAVLWLPGGPPPPTVAPNPAETPRLFADVPGAPTSDRRTPVSGLSVPAGDPRVPDTGRGIAAERPADPAAGTCVRLRDGSQLLGALMITGRDGAAPPTEPPARLLAATADCVTLLLRAELAREAEQEQESGADELAQRAARIEQELAAALDVERRRLATWVLTGTTRRLAEVTRRREAFADSVRAEPDRAGPSLRELRVAVDELIEYFRTVVRAVHPSTLRGRGTAAALGELAASHSRRVHCGGDFGRRVGWEIESGIYHAAAAVLTALPEHGDAEVTVHFSRAAGRLAVRVADPAAALEPLRASLLDDARRLAALGGGLRVRLSLAEVAVVDLWLPERPSSGDSDDA
ncbi:sensor histidine kinase [Frankia sp. AgKG'84/4]|uniref:hypothetical protein n=1 Tax=Frankia sp. AgKG'84/4 TaxID=573490 RepID=UPI0020105FA4|nr:hypothetical protein [Frankia sp. AgKG'84/4]MCL9795635.1 hypothetical protein [Frankia sp. AgKG'84/4]